MKRIIIRNGKKYIVNTPDWDNNPVGWEDGIGSGGQVGTLWMISTDGNWYPVNTTLSQGTQHISVNQTSIGYQDNSTGVQLLLCDDGNSYLTYLSGSPNNVVFQVNQTPFTGSAYPKPDLLLQSVTNGNYYMVTLINNSGTIQPSVNQNYISSSWIVDM